MVQAAAVNRSRYSGFPEGPYQFNVQKCSLEMIKPNPK